MAEEKLSQAKKQVEWCLRKAKKELEKNNDHKGLVEVEADATPAQEHIEKAEHNLKALIHNKNQFSDWSINMGFYTLYHCCLAVIAKFGYASKNQQCTLAAIELLIEEKKVDESFKDYLDKIKAEPDKKEERILAMREFTQYTTIQAVEEKKVQELLELCQDMINETKGIIGQ